MARDYSHLRPSRRDAGIPVERITIGEPKPAPVEKPIIRRPPPKDFEHDQSDE